MEFVSSSSYSFGVDIEFQILDGSDLNLVPFAPLLLEQAPQILLLKLSLDFHGVVRDVQKEFRQ